MSTDGLTPIEQNIVRMATALENYGTLSEAIEAIATARTFQRSQWPAVNATDAGGRTAEEWQLLLNHAIAKLNAVYYESNGTTPEGRARYAKYAAVVANLSLWLVQATIGTVNDDKRIAEGVAATRASLD